ncbi:MAG: PDDEXK nuclease domain-containing protein [Dysgonamonadaceae bacterium]|jgi:predicted nuclease of restriction endonuclease-like (RecB) superfamily|nr:PDDEXK nuclease domain-containing protein [Dysgonamonadaceae bacterium]
MDIIKQYNEEYKQWLNDLKQRIRNSQIKASVHINTSILELYWSIGADIVEKQAEATWGSGIIKKLSADLRSEFPHLKGFSETNLRYTRRFYLFYNQKNIIQHQVGAISHQSIISESENKKNVPIQHQVGAESTASNIIGTVPWRHHIEILNKCKSFNEAMFYVQKTVENGWSRAVLMHFIEADLYSAQGKSITNFSRLLPEPQSDLANEIIKDPYNFDFVTLTEPYKERELEDALTENITKFLLELGQGFAYVGRQVPVKVGESERFIDLLFYHLDLRCYVVIELKATKFEAEFAGKLGMYVAAINHQRKKPSDNPTIGMIICKTKDNIEVEYSLESSSQPIGISEYQLSKLLPENYKSALPSIEEIEEGLKG